MRSEHRILYKKDSAGKVRYWKIHQDGNKYWVEHGILGGKAIESEPTVAQPKNVGRSNATTPTKQAELEIASLYQSQLDQGYHEELDVVHSGERTVQFFEPMLCDRWNDKVERHVFGQRIIYSQPKLDGIRCLARANGLWSRNGKKIVSCPHIERELKPVFDRAPNLILDGELYNHDFKEDFESLTSMIKKEKLTDDEIATNAKYVQYHVYDTPSINGGFDERFRALREGLEGKEDLYPSIRLTETTEISGLKMENQIDEVYNYYVADGYEGQIIRLTGAAYEEGKRSKNLIKRKPLYDKGEEREVEILDILEGKGNWSGKAKTAILQWDKGKTTKATIKGSMTYMADVLKNKKDFIGTQATVTYQNLTGDGMPRFPVIKELNRKY